MVRSKCRLFVLGFIGLFLLTLMASTTNVQAELWGGDFVEDERLHILVEFDGTPITDASEASPIDVNLESTMNLFLQVNVTNDVPLNMSGTIWFYFNDIPIIPIAVHNPETNATWVPLPHNASIPAVNVPLNFSQILEVYGVDLVTGLFKASLDFSYYEMDPSNATSLTTEYILSQQFYFKIPSDGFLDTVTTVAGAIVTVSTATAIVGFSGSIKSILEGIQTAHKLRSIQKKTSEIRSLPNLTVLGALPALFSMVAGLTILGKKKKKKEEDYSPDATMDGGVSDFLVKERLREVAPDAWLMDKCPVCKKDWHKKTNTCKKCKIDEATARTEYAERLVGKVGPALKAIGKKKSLSIRKIAKKTKSNEYNAGVIGAALVDTGTVEVQKIETPLRGFVMNIGGLVFLVLTWQQLLGGASSQFQTTLTFVGAGLSFAVIVALYIARKTQIKTLRIELDSGGKMMPTEEEKLEREAEPAIDEVEEPESTSDIVEEEPKPEDDAPDDSQDSFLDSDEIAEMDSVEDDEEGL
ncbi:MAG: hypothetical protein ACTSUB_03075 [Candidatus Thorarchaeota archaeon]